MSARFVTRIERFETLRREVRLTQSAESRAGSFALMRAEDP